MGLTERALRELMRILETGKFPSDDSAASDLYFAVREALENRRILSDRTAERDHLRAELIKVLRFVGGQATPDVSTAFLLNVGEEVSAVLAGMAGVTANLRAEVGRLRGELAYIKQQLEWVEENGDTYQKSALMDFIRRTIHGISHTAAIKEALAARDDQQRREGAAEWLENAAREGGYYERSSEGMLEEAKQLREGGE